MATPGADHDDDDTAIADEEERDLDRDQEDIRFMNRMERFWVNLGAPDIPFPYVHYMPGCPNGSDSSNENQEAVPSTPSEAASDASSYVNVHIMGLDGVIRGEFAQRNPLQRDDDGSDHGDDDYLEPYNMDDDDDANGDLAEQWDYRSDLATSVPSQSISDFEDFSGDEFNQEHPEPTNLNLSGCDTMTMMGEGEEVTSATESSSTSSASTPTSATPARDTECKMSVCWCAKRRKVS